MLVRVMTDGLRFERSFEIPSERIPFPLQAMGSWHLVVLGFYPHDGGFVDKEDFFGTLFVFHIGQNDERLF
jgi:hypothetical protein